MSSCYHAEKILILFPLRQFLNSSAFFMLCIHAKELRINIFVHTALFVHILTHEAILYPIVHRQDDICFHCTKPR